MPGISQEVDKYLLMKKMNWVNYVMHLYSSQLSSSWNTCQHHLTAPGFLNIKLSWSSFRQGWELHAFIAFSATATPFAPYVPLVSKYLSQVSMPFQPCPC